MLLKIKKKKKKKNNLICSSLAYTKHSPTDKRVVRMKSILLSILFIALLLVSLGLEESTVSTHQAGNIE